MFFCGVVKDRNPYVQLRSAYQNYYFDDEPLFTNYTNRFIGCIDYIFYDPAYVELKGVDKLPTNQKMKDVKALPNELCSSDHLPLKMYADFLEEESVCERVSPPLKNCRPTLTASFFQKVYV